MTRSEASRINGAKSHGPATPQGKAKSSRNAATHGFYSDQVVIAGESQEEFDLHLAGYIDHYHPASLYEHQLVSDLAALRWRLRRIVSMETAVLDTEISRLAATEEHKDSAPVAIQTVAFSNLVNGPALNRLHRFESRLRRSIEDTEQSLFLAQEDRDTRESEPAVATESTAPANVQNEPTVRHDDAEAEPIEALLREHNPNITSHEFLNACVEALRTMENARAAAA